MSKGDSGVRKPPPPLLLFAIFYLRFKVQAQVRFRAGAEKRSARLAPDPSASPGAVIETRRASEDPAQVKKIRRGSLARVAVVV
jgi:hypothetical protein